MPLIEVKTDPTRRDLLVFALLWPAFFAILARITVAGGPALLYAAAFTGVLFLISFALNTEHPRRRQAAGALIPLALLSAWFGWRAASGASPDTARTGAWVVSAAIAVAGVIAVAASPRAGRALYRGWMSAALPIGWTFSMFVLGVAFYGVITPIGLVMRGLGRDPLRRKFDKAATTYWTPRRPVTDPARYLRQS